MPWFSPNQILESKAVVTAVSVKILKKYFPAQSAGAHHKTYCREVIPAVDSSSSHVFTQLKPLSCQIDQQQHVVWHFLPR